MKNPHPIETARNADLRGSLPALLRAAERARQLAARTGTALVVMRNGEVAHVYPPPESLLPRVLESNPPYGNPE